MAFFVTEKKKDVLIVRFAFDEISLQDKEILKNELTLLLGKGNKFVFNMAKIGFLSSMMIATVVFFAKEVTSQKGTIRLCMLSDNAKEVLKITRIDQLFKTFATEEEALQGF